MKANLRKDISKVKAFRSMLSSTAATMAAGSRMKCVDTAPKNGQMVASMSVTGKPTRRTVMVCILGLTVASMKVTSRIICTTEPANTSSKMDALMTEIGWKEKGMEREHPSKQMARREREFGRMELSRSGLKSSNLHLS